MQYESPDYEGLVIVTGEKARPGAFYVPTFEQSLSQIANQAYGVGTLSFVLRINKSQWNRDHCVYRVKSGKCYSKTSSSSLALSQNNFGDGAWIALCQSDTQSDAAALGLHYPMIWVPGVHGEEPEDLALDPGPTSPTPLKPGLTLGEPEAEVLDPIITLTPEVPGRGEPVLDDPQRGGEGEGGIPGWVIGVGVGALVLGGAAVLIAKSRKKGG